MKTSRTRLTAAVLAVLITAAACGPKTANTTPQAQVSQYGGKVTEALVTLTKTVRDLEAKGIIPTGPTGQFMVVMNEASAGAKDLYNVLNLYDAATTPSARQDLATKVTAILNALNASMLRIEGIYPTLGPGAAEQIGKLVGAIMDTLTTIRQLIPAMQGGS